jgi:hypothetical protein
MKELCFKLGLQNQLGDHLRKENLTSAELQQASKLE